jgi:hypothetical protein
MPQARICEGDRRRDRLGERRSTQSKGAMKKITLVLASAILLAGAASAHVASTKVNVNKIDAPGVGARIAYGVFK